jgi:hypothetical protein
MTRCITINIRDIVIASFGLLEIVISTFLLDLLHEVEYALFWVVVEHLDELFFFDEP